MPDIRHRVGIAAPAERVYHALATTDGLAQWWTREVGGEAKVGANLEFSFGGSEPDLLMEVTDLVPGSRVSWRCVKGPDEWLETTYAFDLTSTDGEATPYPDDMKISSWG